jgi:hypothetical protein
MIISFVDPKCRQRTRPARQMTDSPVQSAAIVSFDNAPPAYRYVEAGAVRMGQVLILGTPRDYLACPSARHRKAF